MLVENQWVKIITHSLSKKAKERYYSLGYNTVYDEPYIIVRAEDLSDGSKKRVNVECDYCNKIYETAYVIYFKGMKKNKKSCCSVCTGKKTQEITLNKRAEKYWRQLEDICKKQDYILITTINEFTDLKMKIKYICPIHGEQEQMLDNILRGHTCFKCSYENKHRFDTNRNDIEFVKNIIEKTNNNILLNSEEYENCFKRNLKIKCGICNQNTFQTSFENYRHHGINRCRKCSSSLSSGEKIIEDFIIERNIDYIREKRFQSCKDNRCLPFDFYLPDYNMCIEFDGQHHYEPVWGEERFKKTLLHDGMKNKYCEQNNIKLLRIPYWEGHNIEEILIKELDLKSKAKKIIYIPTAQRKQNKTA